jgi:hypothetical protein
MISEENTAAAQGINPKRAHFNAGTAKNASGASFAQDLRAWLYTQKLFSRQADFAAAISVSLQAVQLWLTGRAFPGDPICDKLYAVTELDCFSPAMRATARREHEQKRGLSHSAIAKREQRQHLTSPELADCMADPEKAFTIRGDEWIACLECGQLLKQIRDRGSAAHLRDHGMTATQYRIGTNPAKPRYGPNRGLICNALALTKRANLMSREKKLAPGTPAYLATVRPLQRGKKMPPEFSRKQKARKVGLRNPSSHWSSNIPDGEFLWSWLFEGRSREEIAKSLGITPGGVWTRLEAIIGTPVKHQVSKDDLLHAPRAMEIVHECGNDEAKLKEKVEQLCTVSRKTRKSDGVARTVMFWMPRAIDWRRRNPTRAQAMTGTDLGRVFAAEELPKLKPPKPAPKRDSGGRPAGMTPERFEEAQKLLAGINRLGGKRGAIKQAANEVYPGIDPTLRADRARQTLGDYRKQKREKN